MKAQFRGDVWPGIDPTKALSEDGGSEMWGEGASDLWGRLEELEREIELLDAVPTRLEGGVNPAVEDDFQPAVGAEAA